MTDLITSIPTWAYLVAITAVIGLAVLAIILGYSFSAEKTDGHWKIKFDQIGLRRGDENKTIPKNVSAKIKPRKSKATISIAEDASK